MAIACVALRYTHLGMMVWVWSSLFPPNEYLFGFAQNIPFNKISAICTVLALAFDKRRSFTLDPLLIIVVLFVGEVSLALVTSDVPAGWGDDLYQRLLKVVIAALIIRFAAVTRLRLHSVLIAICLAIGAGVVDEGLKFILSGGAHRVQGPTSWGDNNCSAAMIIMVMPLIFFLYKYSVNKWMRRACLIGECFCVVSVIGTYSRGGFIGLLLLGGIVIANAKRRLLPIVLVFAIAVSGLAFLPSSWMDRMQTVENAGQDDSFMGRVTQWKILTLMAFDHPILGRGLLANMHLPTWQPYAARLQSELTFISTPQPDEPHASHSIYFQVLGEDGFTGLFLFLLIYWQAFRYTAEIKKSARGKPNLTWAADMAAAIRICLFLYLVTGAALPIPYNEMSYLLLGCLSALRHIQMNEISNLQVSGVRSRSRFGPRRQQVTSAYRSDRAGGPSNCLR